MALKCTQRQVLVGALAQKRIKVAWAAGETANYQRVTDTGVTDTGAPSSDPSGLGGSSDAEGAVMGGAAGLLAK